MNIFKKFILSLTAVTLVASGVLVLFNPVKASASTPSYNKSDLIADDVFTDASSMNAGQIQTFLSSLNSNLASYKVTESCGSTSGAHYAFYKAHYSCSKSVLASQMISDAAKAYGISPRSILATMEKEQSLVTKPPGNSDALTAARNCAMGYYSCTQDSGFFKQVDGGAWQFRADIDLMNGESYWGYSPSSYPCSGATSLYSAGLYPDNKVTFADPHYLHDPYSTSRPVTFVIANSSTAALYCYTPYVGPYTSEGPYGGTGYSGSYNFVYYFELWFGSVGQNVPTLANTTHPDGTLVKAYGSSTVYLIINQQLHPIPSLAVFESNNYNWADVFAETVPDQSLTINSAAVTYKSGSLVRGENDNRVWVLESCSVSTPCTKELFTSADLFKGLGFNFDAVQVISLATINAFGNGPNISAAPAPHPKASLVLDKATGKVYQIGNDVKSWVPDMNIFKANRFSWANVEDANAADLALANSTNVEYPEGALVEPSNSGSVYVIDINESDGNAYQKRHIANQAVFSGLGYTSSDVYVDSPANLPSMNGADVTQP